MAAAERLTDVARRHPAVGDLASLLSELRTEDYLRIDPERVTRCSELLARLDAAGVRLTDADAAADWLAPVLASSPREQSRVHRRFAAREQRRQAAAGERAPRTEDAVPPPAAVVRDEKASALTFRRTLAILGGLALLAAALIAGWYASRTAFSDGPQNDVIVIPSVRAPLEIGLALALFAGVVLLAAALLRWRRLERQSLAAGLSLGLLRRQVQPAAHGIPLFDPGPLRPAMRALRRHADVLFRRQVDVPRTVAETVSAGGLPHIAFAGRPRLPAYLMIVALTRPDDHLRLAAEKLLSQLRAAAVRVDAYLVGRNPAVLYPWAGDKRSAPELRAQVYARHAGDRLLLLSDGRGIEEAPLQFERSVLLTPRSPAAWDQREASLRERGFSIVPLSSEGLEAVALWLSGPREAEPIAALPANAALERMPPLVARALAERNLPPVEQEKVLHALKAWLGDPAFLLVAASAMGGPAGPGTTDRLAGHLANLGQESPDERASQRMLQLPWLRGGALPDWLGRRLPVEIPAAAKAAAADAWLLYLAGEEPLDRGRTLAEGERRRLRALVNAGGAAMAEPGLQRMLELDAESGRWSLPERRDLLLGLAALAVSVVAVLAAVPLAAVVDLAVNALKPALKPFLSELRIAFGALVIVSIAPVIRPAAITAWAGAAVAGVFLAIIGDRPFDPLSPELVLGLGLLRWSVGRARRSGRPVAIHSLLAPAHPFLNFACVASLAVLLILVSLVSLNFSDNGAPQFLPGEVALVPAILFAASCCGRAVYTGAVPARLGLLAGVGFVSGLAASLYPLVLAADLSLPFPRTDIVGLLHPAAAELRILFAASGGALVLCASSARGYRELAKNVLQAGWGTLLLVGLLLATLVLGGPAQSFGVALAMLLVAVPWRFLAVDRMLRPAAVPRSLRATIAITLCSRATLIALAISAFFNADLLRSLMLDAFAPHQPETLDFSALVAPFSWFVIVAPEYLLLLPMVRALRPDLSQGRRTWLWRDALILLPWGFSLAASPLAGASAPWLALPASAWLARRHGTVALPAIALALLPMLIVPSAAAGIVSLGDPGIFAAALMTAALVARPDRRFATFDAALLRWPQLAGLLCLTLSLHLDVDDNIVAVNFAAGFFALLAFIGLSRIRLRWIVIPLIALAFAAALQPLPGWPIIGLSLGVVSSLRLPSTAATGLGALLVMRILRRRHDDPVALGRARILALLVVVAVLVGTVTADPLNIAAPEQLFLLALLLGASDRRAVYVLPAIVLLAIPLKSSLWGQFLGAAATSAGFAAMGVALVRRLKDVRTGDGGALAGELPQLQSRWFRFGVPALVAAALLTATTNLLSPSVSPPPPPAPNPQPPKAAVPVQRPAQPSSEAKPPTQAPSAAPIQRSAPANASGKK